MLSPMGWDSFGLPAENAAIQTGVHPREFTERQIVTMKAQLRRLGAVYDWTREIASHTPEYYKWDQWLFLQFFEQGLAYKKLAPVNWCPKDQTVLANEQVVDGACERCGTVVIKRDLEQWFFKITDYAERLLNDLATLTEWPERVRVMQENWIGRSEGCQFRMQVADTDLSFEVFTTRPDTVFGMTFAVLAPEHPLVEQLIAGILDEDEARAYIERATRQSEIERLAEGDKSGVFTGRYADQSGQRPPGSDLHRRLRVDGLRNRGDHGRSRPGRSGLGVRREIRTRDHSDRSAPSGLGRQGVHRRWPCDQLGLPRRPRYGRGQEANHRLVRRARASAGEPSSTGCATG